VEIYEVALRTGLRSPFRHADELQDDNEDEDKQNEEKKEGEDRVEPIVLELEGIERRVRKIPVPAGNYSDLRVNEEAVFWLSHGAGSDAKADLMALKIANDDSEAELLMANVKRYDLSLDGKHLLAQQDDAIYVFGAGTSAPKELADNRVGSGRLVFSHRCTRGLAADLYRRLAYGARLLL
jgi:tricorn protease